MLFDTHCHLDHEDFDADREEVWARAVGEGVTHALIPAVHPEGWGRTLASALPGARWCALGVHPWALLELSDAALAVALASLADVVDANRGRVVAVGECGVDGRLDPARAPLARQLAALSAQLDVAEHLGLPVVLHAVDAHDELIEALAARPRGAIRGAVHAYSGGAARVPRYTSLGMHLSFGGVITRDRARRPIASLRATPASMLLLETDAPSQPPAGRATRRCEPRDLVEVLRHAAAARGEGEVALAARCHANARALFGV